MQLQPTQIGDLRCGTHHVDTILYARLIVEALQPSGISCLIEDIHKIVEGLLIYDHDPDANINSVFPAALFSPSNNDIMK